MATPEQPQAQPRHVLLVSAARTASNLLVKMLNLNEQPAVVQGEAREKNNRGYHLRPMSFLAMESGLWEKPPLDWPADMKAKIMGAGHASFAALESTRALAEETGTMAFTKEHAVLMLDPELQSQYLFGRSDPDREKWRLDKVDPPKGKPVFSPNNITILSDEYLRKWRMVFLIRNPIQVGYSMFSVMHDDVWRKRLDDPTKDANMAAIRSIHIANLTYRWQRSLYNLAVELGQEPLVLDADDMIGDPTAAAVRELAGRLGMDPDKIITEWQPTPVEEVVKKFPRAQKMLGTLLASNGLQQDKLSKGLDVDVEAPKWREEFGEEDGRLLEKLVKEMIPDYEWLMERRLKV